jgi:hypothetical protein
MKARMFTQSDYKEPERTEKREELIRKIHKQISHLTLDRASAVKIDGRDRAEIFKMLMQDLDIFAAHLRIPVGPTERVATAAFTTDVRTEQDAGSWPTAHVSKS